MGIKMVSILTLFIQWEFVVQIVVEKCLNLIRDIESVRSEVDQVCRAPNANLEQNRELSIHCQNYGSNYVGARLFEKVLKEFVLLF